MIFYFGAGGSHHCWDLSAALQYSFVCDFVMRTSLIAPCCCVCVSQCVTCDIFNCDFLDQFHLQINDDIYICNK